MELGGWETPPRDDDEEAQDYIQGNCHILAAIDSEKAESQYNIISAVGKIKAKPFVVLFDTGASHNFASPHIVELLKLQTLRSNPRPVVLANGKVRYTEGRRVNFNIEFPGIEVSMGAEIMDMGKYDLIVGMKYLIPAKAFIDCASRKVILTAPNGKQVEIAGNEVVPIMRCMSMEKIAEGN